MAMIIYNPKYSIDTINRNFANKGSQTTITNFVSNNFTVNNTTIADTVNIANVIPPAPIDMNLVAQILTDYGTGPITIGMTEALVIINNNVQVGSIGNSDIFGNEILAGGNTDFRYVTDDQGIGIVLANLQMTTLLPLAPNIYQTPYNAMILNITRDLRKGIYDPNNYLPNIQFQSRQIAQTLVNTYG